LVPILEHKGLKNIIYALIIEARHSARYHGSHKLAENR
jgi:hypothetical protein